MMTVDSPGKFFVKSYWDLTQESLRVLCSDLETIPRYCLKTYREASIRIQEHKAKSIQIQYTAQRLLAKLFVLDKLYRVRCLHNPKLDSKELDDRQLVMVPANSFDWGQKYHKKQTPYDDAHDLLLLKNPIGTLSLETLDESKAVPREPIFYRHPEGAKFEAVRYKDLQSRYIGQEDVGCSNQHLLIRQRLVSEHNELSNKCLILLAEVSAIDRLIFDLLPRQLSQTPKSLLTLLEDHIAYFHKQQTGDWQAVTKALESLKARLQRLPVEHGTKAWLEHLREACQTGLLDETQPQTFRQPKKVIEVTDHCGHLSRTFGQDLWMEIAEDGTGYLTCRQCLNLPDSNQKPK